MTENSSVVARSTAAGPEVGPGHVEALVRQDAGERVADVVVVLYEQHVGHR